MVLAAGLGTRLQPLTNNRPKALVTVAGQTLLEITLRRLCAFGVREVIINAHHFSGMIAAYLEANGNFGMHIELSSETELLDTGGGLKKAAHFFLRDGSDEPFLLHNVDVISTIDLGEMVRFHADEAPLATLAAAEREASRYLLFDESRRLCGRKAKKDAEPEIARPAKTVEALAFAGIHVLSPRIFGKMAEQGAFSIIDAYLRLAAQGETITAFRADSAYWRDLGRPESVAAATRDLETGLITLG
ncbi:MAG TPA: nucleotidyltransferase family protein [Acidobacteriaceae bacterium]|jgi:NDP-sugar pyrophosphorylase family protein|nr:nucleotidyltransferase family protein [Acidobacteriaceae bacterium]